MIGRCIIESFKEKSFLTLLLLQVCDIMWASSFLAKEMCNSKVSIKVCFFIWEVTWKKILTVDQLMKQVWTMVN